MNSTAAPWRDLPAHCIAMVGCFLDDMRDLGNAACACRAFNASVFDLVETLTVRPPPAPQSELAWIPASAPGTTQLLRRQQFDSSSSTTTSLSRQSYPDTSTVARGMTGKLQGALRRARHASTFRIMLGALKAMRAVDVADVHQLLMLATDLLWESRGRRARGASCAGVVRVEIEVRSVVVAYHVLKALAKCRTYSAHRKKLVQVDGAPEGRRLLVQLRLEKPYCTYFAAYDSCVLEQLGDIVSDHGSHPSMIDVELRTLWLTSCSQDCIRLLGTRDTALRLMRRAAELTVDVVAGRDVTLIDLTHVSRATRVALCIHVTKPSHTVHVLNPGVVQTVCACDRALSTSCTSWITPELLTGGSLATITCRDANDVTMVLDCAARCRSRAEPRPAGGVELIIEVDENAPNQLHTLHALTTYLSSMNLSSMNLSSMNLSSMNLSSMRKHPIRLTLRARTPHARVVCRIMEQYLRSIARDAAGACSLRLCPQSEADDDGSAHEVSGDIAALTKWLENERGDHTFYWMRFALQGTNAVKA